MKKGTHAITVVYGEAEGFTGSTGTLADGQVIENTWAWLRIAVPWRAAVYAVVALLHLISVVRVRNLLVRVLYASVRSESPSLRILLTCWALGRRA